MANIKSAKKRILVTESKTAVNKRVKNSLKSTLKEFETALAAKDFALAEETLKTAEKKLMKAGARNVISKNAASRKVSRLNLALNKAKKAE